MSIVIHEGRYISAIGHASDRAKCALLSSLLTTIANLLAMAGDAGAVALEPGRFRLDVGRVKTKFGEFLVAGLIANLRNLSQDHPHDFEIMEIHKSNK